MKSGTQKPIIVIGTFIIFLTLTVALISIFWPRYEEQFFEFGLLGPDKLAESYFPKNNSAIEVGSQINWYIYLHNHYMGSQQNVIVKVKLVNSSIELPNDQSNKPTSFDSFTEFPLSLSTGDTLFVPLSWSIVETISNNNSTILKQLAFNDQTVDVDVSTSSNSFFRMIFELWVYDSFSETYKFGWNSGEEFSSASFYIGFRVS